MFAALSAASARGQWILCNESATELIAEVSWTDPDSKGLSTEMASHFGQLLDRARLDRRSLTGLFGVAGPGAFTGLRMSSAFLQGLARALVIPLHPIPTFDLLGKPFFIPLRHQKAKLLDWSEAQAAGLEFLKLESSSQATIRMPRPGERVLGLRDEALWPEPNVLLNGVRRNLAASEQFVIRYGLEPKISGVREQKKDA